MTIAKKKGRFGKTEAQHKTCDYSVAIVQSFHLKIVFFLNFIIFNKILSQRSIKKRFLIHIFFSPIINTKQKFEENNENFVE